MPVVIVSHKTATAHLDGKAVDLRRAAREWIETALLAAGESGLTSADIFFETTRAEKLDRIRALGCTFFIDDLVEVFAEPEFPTSTIKLLFAPHGVERAPDDVHIFNNWHEIVAFFFHDEED